MCPISRSRNSTLCVRHIKCLTVWEIYQVLSGKCSICPLRLRTTTIRLHIHIVACITLQTINLPLKVCYYKLVFHHICEIRHIGLHGGSKHNSETIRIQRAIPTKSRTINGQTIRRDITWIITCRHWTNNNIIQSDTTTHLIYAFESELISGSRSSQNDGVGFPTQSLVLVHTNLYPLSTFRSTVVNHQCIYVTRILHLRMRENQNRLEHIS